MSTMHPPALMPIDVPQGMDDPRWGADHPLAEPHGPRGESACVLSASDVLAAPNAPVSA